MSGLITKATKMRAAASKKLRIKAKKAAPRKPVPPGRIKSAPKNLKSRPKKVTQTKRSGRSALLRKPASRSAKAAPKKLGNKKSLSKRTKQVASKRPVRKAAPKRPVVAKAKSKAASRKPQPSRRRLLPPRTLPPPPKKPPSPGTLAAVRAFEQALRLFNRHDFTGARSAFLSIAEKFAEESEILARVRTYAAICDQRLARAPSIPRNPDALYDQGVFEFNKGNTSDAIELFEKALKANPRADHVYYSLAAAYARLNEATDALDSLRRAITLRPGHRSHARRDLDFASLHDNEGFRQLTGFGYDLGDE
jgi:tetratricopeptide (TPR) repeat protein